MDNIISEQSLQYNVEKNHMSKNELMKKLSSYDFAMKDLILYLDTHPNDRKALMLFNDVSKKANELKKEYENLYGPLTANMANRSTDRWAWIDDPWPWENK